MNITQPTKTHSAALNWCTPDGDGWIAYLARQSSPKNQAKTKRLIEGLDSTSVPLLRDAYQSELEHLTISLLKFCAQHGHWSVFEQACMSVTIKTTRAISPQILRHNSFRFQEFSQRYAVVTESIEVPEMRVVDGQKRNPSVSAEVNPDQLEVMEECLDQYQRLYDVFIGFGYHPECARNFLPLCAPTTLSMTGNIRDWIFYIKNRSSVHAQAEHQMIANDCRSILEASFPLVYRSVEDLLT